MPKCNLCGIDFEVNQVKRLQEGDTAILICNDCEHELQGALASKSDAKRYLAQLEKNPIIEQEQEEILVSFIEKHGSVFSVPRILSYHNLSEAAIVFAQHKIDTEEIFETLTDEELQSIGIMELGTRKKILALIKQRNAEKWRQTLEMERGTQEQTSATAQVSEHQEKQNQPPHEPDTNVTVQAPAQEKAGGGVWAVVGVLIVIVLGIIIIGSL